MPARRPFFLPIALMLALSGGVLLAQEDDRGVAPVDSSGSFEVSGVQVDVTAKSAEAARYAGWRIAQRKGWEMLSRRMGGGGGLVSDGTLDSMVSGIVVENEQIGPTRYIARLGVLFNRARAGSILGVASEAARSSPMLVIPVEWSGGAGRVFERRSDWQEAWARYRTGNSAVDYVRPTGTGADALLLNVGQVARPGRGWWRTILDQYGANDILVPVVRLYRQWPGGPIIGAFEARHGPDNQLITRFTLRVGDGDGLAALLDAGVKRMDEAYEQAMQQGMLGVDPSLLNRNLNPTPTPTPLALPTGPVDEGALLAETGTAVSINIQVDTPNAAAVTGAEAALRAIPGVHGAVTTSLALGGVSVVRVTYDADPALLRTSLETRGWIVQGSGTTLRIRRGSAPTGGAPAATTDNNSG